MKYELRLYITGHTTSSQRAIDNLQKLCQSQLEAHRYRLEVIDVLENPELAEEARIVATPTLVKNLPPPMRKLIGDLSDRDKVLLGLDLTTEQ